MRLWKAHGLGNDYLVWEGERSILCADFVQQICHRHCGLGADGILEPHASSRASFGVRIWNPDGSIAEKSGNGLRIFAWWIWRTKQQHQFSIDTGSDIVQCKVDPQTAVVSVEMGKARFVPSQIPCTIPLWGREWLVAGEPLRLWTVGMGNPHCVAFFSAEVELDTLPWREWGKELECSEIFPNRSNIQFAKVLDPHHIEIRIWERGAGETAASGSSSCAVAAVAYRMGWVAEQLSISMPGGRLEIEIGPEIALNLKGPVTEVGRMELHQNFFLKKRLV